MRTKIKKAIIPVAGMGTRFLPATKAQPKEMLAVVDKPVIQYIVEEAVSAGIEEIIFVTAIGKRAIEDHFDRNFELEYRLEQKQKREELEHIKEIGKMAKFAFVRQAKPLGDGHAILSAASFVGKDEPVAVFFGDDIIIGQNPAIGELIEVFEKYQNPVVAISEVPESEISNYGIVAGKEIEKDVWEIDKFIEKPSLENAPSNMAAIGRFIITGEILKTLEKQTPGKDGEIRLAETFSTFIKDGHKVNGRVLNGKRFDCGNKLQFVIAQLELGLLHPEIGDGLRDYMSRTYLKNNE